jgi:septation ring formation regulator EzrA
MSSSEKDEIIGRLVREHSEAKRELDLLRTHCYRVGSALYDVGEHLKSYDFSSANHALNQNANLIEKYANGLQTLIKEFNDRSNQVNEYSDQLRRLGITG